MRKKCHRKESLGFSLSLRLQEILGNPCCQLLKGTIAFETKEPTGMERVIAKGGLGDRRRLQSAGPGGLKRPAETLKLPSLGSNDAKAPAKMSLKGVHLT